MTARYCSVRALSLFCFIILMIARASDASEERVDSWSDKTNSPTFSEVRYVRQDPLSTKNETAHANSLEKAASESASPPKARNEEARGDDSVEATPENTAPPSAKTEGTDNDGTVESSPEITAASEAQKETANGDGSLEASPESTVAPRAGNRDGSEEVNDEKPNSARKDGVKEDRNENTTPSSARKVCGPEAVSGRVHFRGWNAKFPWSTLSTGTSCRWVSFGSRPFPASQDLIILLTADRFDAQDEPYHAPNVWGEALNGKGFHVCVHIPNVKNERVSWTKDKVAVSWMALNRFSARKMAHYKDMYHAYWDLPDDSARCRKNMPRSLDAGTQVLLTTAFNPGVRFGESYIPNKPTNGVEDALTSWIQPSSQAGAQDEFCLSRPLRATSKGLSGVKVTVLGFKRDKETSGVIKLALMDGRACERVPISEKIVGEQRQIHLSVRVHTNDAVRTHKRGNTVTAWLTARGEDSFTVCAEGVGAEDGPKNTHNSVHISWIALPQPNPEGEQCQTVKTPAVRLVPREIHG